MANDAGLKLWLNETGQLIVDDKGQPILCSECPCQEGECRDRVIAKVNYYKQRGWQSESSQTLPTYICPIWEQDPITLEWKCVAEAGGSLFCAIPRNNDTQRVLRVISEAIPLVIAETLSYTDPTSGAVSYKTIGCHCSATYTGCTSYLVELDGSYLSKSPVPVYTTEDITKYKVEDGCRVKECSALEDFLLSYEEWYGGKLYSEGALYLPPSEEMLEISGAGESIVNGEYTLISGTHLAVDAVYMRETYRIEYEHAATELDVDRWCLYDANMTVLYFSTSLTGSWQLAEGAAPAPVVALKLKQACEFESVPIFAQAFLRLKPKSGGFEWNYVPCGRCDIINFILDGSGAYIHQEIPDICNIAEAGRMRELIKSITGAYYSEGAVFKKSAPEDSTYSMTAVGIYSAAHPPINGAEVNKLCAVECTDRSTIIDMTDSIYLELPNICKCGKVDIRELLQKYGTEYFGLTACKIGAGTLIKVKQTTGEGEVYYEYIPTANMQKVGAGTEQYSCGYLDYRTFSYIRKIGEDKYRFGWIYPDGSLAGSGTTEVPCKYAEFADPWLPFTKHPYQDRMFFTGDIIEWHEENWNPCADVFEHTPEGKKEAEAYAASTCTGFTASLCSIVNYAVDVIGTYTTDAPDFDLVERPGSVTDREEYYLAIKAYTGYKNGVAYRAQWLSTNKGIQTPAGFKESLTVYGPKEYHQKYDLWNCYDHSHVREETFTATTTIDEDMHYCDQDFNPNIDLAEDSEAEGGAHDGM